MKRKKIQHKIFAFKAPVIEKKRKYLAILEKKITLLICFLRQRIPWIKSS